MGRWLRLMVRRIRSKSFHSKQWDGIRVPHVEPFNRLVDEIATPRLFQVEGARQ